MSSAVSTPLMAAAGGVEHLLRAAEAVDRLGDKAAIPGVAGALDAPLAVAAAGIGLGQHAAVGRGQRRVAEQPPGGRRIAARQIDGGGGRPFAAEQLGDRHDRVADAADQRVAVLGIAERRRRSARRAASCRNRARAAPRRRTRPARSRPAARCRGSDRGRDSCNARSSRPAAPRPGRRSSRQRRFVAL